VTDYADYSIEALESELIRLSNERRAIREKQVLIKQALDRKLSEEAARLKLAEMNDAEIAALKQLVGVNTASAKGAAHG